MKDLMYLGILALFFAATYGLLKMCEWLFDDQQGGRS
jgi:hypothetical protein